MANVKKITKKVVFGEMRNIFEEMNRQDLVEFVDHELELIEKKSSSKKTGTNETTEEIKKMIIAGLVKAGKNTTIAELLATDEFKAYTYKDKEDVKTLSTSKVSSVMTQLIKDNKVIRTEEKRKAYFSLMD